MMRAVRSTWVLAGGIAFLVLGLAGHAMSTHRSHPPLRVHYANAGGPVLFAHSRHAEMDGACADCHHELVAGEIATPCLTCHHDGSFEPAEWDDADMAGLHAEMAAGDDAESCLGCHDHDQLTQPLRAASQSVCAQCHEADLAAVRTGHNCNGCHAAATEAGEARACRACHRSGEGEAATCEQCHADDGYAADMLPHAELAAIEGHTCDACHVPSRDPDALHHACNRCHLDLERGTFFARTQGDAETVCRTCHMKQ